MSNNNTAVQQRTVPISQVVVVDGFNPRQTFDDNGLAELVASVRERGVLQPLRVAPVNGGGSYRLIAGGRRLRAAQLAEIGEVPVIIDTGDRDEQELLVDALVENLHRSDLNPVEEALAYQRLKDAGLVQRGIVEKVGKPAAHVRERLALLKLPSTVWPRIEDRSVPLLAISALIGLEEIHVGLSELLVSAMLSKDDDDPYTWAEFSEDPLYVLLALVHADNLPEEVFVVGGSHRYALECFTLGDKAVRDAEKLGELLGTPTPAWSFTPADFETAAALGAGHGSKQGWGPRVIVGSDVASQLVCDGLARQLKDARARDRQAKQTAATNGSPSPAGDASDPEVVAQEQAEQTAREREAEQVQRQAAANHNDRLGAAIVDRLSRIKVDSKVMGILTSIDVAGTLGQLAMRGARYGFPGWVPPLADGERVVHYLGQSDALAKAREYLAGAKTPGDIAGRCLALIAMAIFADETAVAASSRTGHVVQVGPVPWQHDVGAWIDEYVAEHVPAKLIADQVKERKLRREADAAKRDAIAQLEATIDALGGAETVVTGEQLDELAETAKELLGQYSPRWYEIERKLDAARTQKS